MNKIELSTDFKISPIVHGHWRLHDWKLSNQELLKLTQQAIELGVTTFDHADIYGDYTCEKIFGEALRLKKICVKTFRLQLNVVSNCCRINFLNDQ